MRSKLFTPLNFGAFDLSHRLVVDWGHAVADKLGANWADLPIQAAALSGGLVVHDPGSLVWSEARPFPAEAYDDMTMVWRRIVDRAKSSHQSILARLTGDFASQFPHAFTDNRDLGPDDGDRIVDAYVAAANRAKMIGFDGIELDAAVGSVTDLVLRSSIKIRSSGPGGSMARQISFVTEPVEALAHAFGLEHVGVRLSPFRRNSMRGAHNNIYYEVVRTLQEQEIAYVNMVSVTRSAGATAAVERLSPAARALRRAYSAILVSSGRQSLTSAIHLVDSRWADAVCFSGASVDAQFLFQVERARAQGNGS